MMKIIIEGMLQMEENFKDEIISLLKQIDEKIDRHNKQFRELEERILNTELDTVKLKNKK